MKREKSYSSVDFSGFIFESVGYNYFYVNPTGTGGFFYSWASDWGQD